MLANNHNQTSDETLAGFRADVDANQTGELIPEGHYVSKVYFSSLASGDRWFPKTATFRGYRVQYLEALITVQVIAGESSGWIVPTAVSTLRWDLRKQSSAVELLRALGGSFVKDSQVTSVGLRRLVTDALEDEPTCLTSIGWVATKRKSRLSRAAVVIHRSMRRFPPDGRGGYVPAVKTADGEFVEARNYVRSWNPL
jgi:hypothetical protein